MYTSGVMNAPLHWLHRFSRVRVLLMISLFVHLVVFVIIFFISQAHGLKMETLAGDSTHYMALAENLSCCSVFSYSTHVPYSPDSVRTPGYPVFLLIFFSLFHSWPMALFVQTLLMSGVPVLLYWICRRIDERLAFVAALIFAIEPTQIFWSSLLMTDALFTLLFLGAVEAFLRWKESQHWMHVLVTGIALGMATLFRPIGLFLWIAFVIAIGASCGVRRLRSALLPMVLLLIGFFLVVGPWMVRSRVLFHSWQISALGSYSFAQANVVQYLHVKTGRTVADIQAEFYAPFQGQRSEDVISIQNIPAYKAFSRKAIAGDVFGYARFHVVKTIPFFFTDSLREIPEILGYTSGLQRPNFSNVMLQGNFFSTIWNYCLQNSFAAFLLVTGSLFWIVIWLGALFAIGAIFQDPVHRVEWLLFFLCVGYFVAASSGPVAQPRYRLPFEGFVIFAACVGWIWVIRHVRALTHGRKFR